MLFLQVSSRQIFCILCVCDLFDSGIDWTNPWGLRPQAKIPKQFSTSPWASLSSREQTLLWWSPLVMKYDEIKTNGYNQDQSRHMDSMRIYGVFECIRCQCQSPSHFRLWDVRERRGLASLKFDPKKDLTCALSQRVHSDLQILLIKYIYIYVISFSLLILINSY